MLKQRIVDKGLGVELQPHETPPRGYIRGRHYQASRPTAFPVDTSRCRFRRVTFLRSSPSTYLRVWSGRTKSRPFSTDKSTIAPSVTCASATKDLGIRNPRLLPHFWILVCMPPLPMVIQ